MSQTIILSLVGEQTIPLVQFIRALPPAGEYWFVETKRTRELQCVANIAKACGIETSKIKTVLVAPEALNFTPRADWNLAGDATLYLNLTSGTKSMMLSVFRHYEGMAQARSYYISIGATTANPVQGGFPKIPLPTLDLKTYLQGLGFTYSFLRPDVHLQQEAKRLLQEVVQKGSPEAISLIAKAQQSGTKWEAKKWYAGEWWEDYLYAAIKQDLQLPDNAIAQSVKLEHCLSQSRTNSDNELDVLFVYQNRLFAVEGKVYAGTPSGSKLTAPIYKLGTIIKNMGLQASGIVCICSNITASNDQLFRMDYLKRISGVKALLTLRDFKRGSNFKNLIK